MATTDYNPKQEAANRKRRRKTSVQLFHLQDPIPNEIADADELKKFFQRWNLVPFAGSVLESGHSLLAWYLALAKLSNTHGSCVSKLNLYAFGGAMRAEYSTVQDFDTGEERRPVPTPVAQQYRDVLFSTIEFEGGWRQVHYWLAWALKMTGNGWIELRAATIMGQTQFVIRYHKVMNVLYLNTKKDEPKMVAVSPVWTDEYLSRKPFRKIPVSKPGQMPVFVENEDGTFSTMYHLCNGLVSWYGRPDSEHADLQKMQEAQHAMYLIKQADVNFIPQLIIEVEEENQLKDPPFDDDDAAGSGFDSFADRWEQNYTMKSDDPQGVVLSSRPFGSRPMAVFQIKPNTNENWFKVTGQDAAERILRAHGCTLRFLGFDASNGFSSDTFLADYVFNMEPVIHAHRDMVTNFMNGILSTVWALIGRQDLDELSITFSSPISAAIEDYKKSKSNEQNNNNGPGSAAVQPGRQGLPA